MAVTVPMCPQCRTIEFVAMQGTHKGVGVDGARCHDQLQQFRCAQCGWALVRSELLDAAKSSPGEDAR